MPSTIYLIDGHALAYRAYYALTVSSSRPWQTSRGEPTAGLYGFTSVLLRILEQEQPQYLAAAFDTGKTFRDALYPEYKATRAKMPDDLRPQIDYIRQMLDAFGIPRLEREGYEADDVLGSLARWAEAAGLTVKIITGDRDLLQLVTERVVVNLPGRSLRDARDYFPEDVYKKLGVYPQQVVDYKALVGDPSDNIPGVRGIGPKTAVRLLAEYNNLDEIYAHLDALKPALRKKLEAHRKDAYLSRDLARIRTDLAVALDLEKARVQRFNREQAAAFFRRFEMRTLLQRLQRLDWGETGLPAATGQLPLFAAASQPAPPSAPQRDVHLVQTEAALDALVRALQEADQLALDTETTDVNPMQAALVGISLAMRPGEGYYVPVGHRQGRQLPLEKVRSALAPFLGDDHLPKVGHNIKYDLVVLAEHGLPVRGVRDDTLLAAWLLQPESRRLGLKALTEDRLGEQMTAIDELIGSGRNQITMDQVPVEQVAAYAVHDAEVTLRLLPLLSADLTRDGLMALYRQIEMPLVPVLAAMERRGILLDVEFFAALSQDLARRLQLLAERIYKTVGQSFNLNSTQQLSVALFEQLGLQPPPGTRKTASGHYSTAASVLEALRSQHPIVDDLLAYRELSKLKSTYVDALPAQINPRTGRLHTTYRQTGVVTGRLASANPNLQNIPIRTALGREVRKGFIAPPGWVLLGVDYSQIELRIVAHMAQDEAMLDAFRQGLDIHAATAAAIYGVPLDEVTKEQRRAAKAINFGLIYGMTPYGLTRSTELTLAEAEDFVKAYFEKFPGVKQYLDAMRDTAARQGYVETLLGRRRYFPALKNNLGRNQKMREEREAINAPVQGTAADIMKLAMIALADALAAAGLSAHLLLQVHDEVILECPEEALAETAQLVQKVMESAYPLSIPLKTEARWGYNWGEMQVLQTDGKVK